MHHFAQTYRIFAGLMVSVLLAGLCLPLVAHACTMQGQMEEMADCCCPPDQAGMMEGMSHHASDTTIPANTQNNCETAPCCVVATPFSGLEIGTLKNINPRFNTWWVPAPQTTYLAQWAEPTTVHFPDTGPPIAYVFPRHLLYATFLI